MLRFFLLAFLDSKDFLFKKFFQSLDLSIIAFIKSFGACSFKVSMKLA